MATSALVIPADSQPAKTSSEILASLTGEQTAEWRKSGKLPDAQAEKPPEVKPKTEAASSPAAKEPPEAPAKAAETPGESVPPKTEPPAKGAEARIKQLLAENKDLTKKLEEAQKLPAVAAPKAKPEAVAKPQRTDADEKGQLKYATEEAFEDAREKWLTEKITADVQKANAKVAEDARILEAQRLTTERWLNSIKLAKEKHADLDEVLEADETGLIHSEVLKSIKGGSVLDSWLTDSVMGVEILYHLAKNPAEIARIQGLNPFQAARALTRLEDSLGAPGTAEVVPAKKEKEEVPTTKKVTGAPAPAAAVGGKGTAPTEEPADTALKKGDFTAYKAAQDAEDRKKKK